MQNPAIAANWVVAAVAFAWLAMRDTRPAPGAMEDTNRQYSSIRFSSEVFTMFAFPGAGAPLRNFGMGVGLAVARQLADQHGGRIEARKRWTRPRIVLLGVVAASAAPADAAGRDDADAIPTASAAHGSVSRVA